MKLLNLIPQLERKLGDIPFALIDLETTGLAPESDRICEIALMRVQRGKEVLRFEQLVNPCCPITPGAFAVNQIDGELLRHAPTFEALLPALTPLLDGAVIVAHNAHFDMTFLGQELGRLGLPALPNTVVDTLALSRAFIEAPRHNLHNLAVGLGAAPPRHRAMSDVVALRVVFEHLLQLLQGRGVRTLYELVQAQWGGLPGQKPHVLPALIQQALLQKQRLRIAYERFDGSVVEREILPLGVGARGTSRVLHAFCYLRNAPRVFNVDRIRLIER